MKTSTIARSLTGLFLAAVSTGTAQQTGLFTATLTGKDAFPPVTTNAVGSVTLAVKNGSVEYKLEVGSITDVTSACIHLKSPKLATVMLYTGPQTGAFTGVLAGGTLGAKELGSLTLSELRHAIQLGEAFVSVHTLKHPGGEIQGKLAPVKADSREDT